MPKVSVIAALFNHEKYIAQSIESVLAQTYTDWELIIWDDGSTDRSLEIARGYAARFSDKIKVFTHASGENRGQEVSRNESLKKSSGELVALLDTDDWYHPQKLAKLVPAFADEQVGLAFGRVQYFEENTGQYHYPKTQVPAATLDGAMVFDELVHDNFVEACGVLFRKNFIDNGLRFDSRFKTCGEYPLWLEIAQLARIRYVPELVAYWRNHGANTGTKFALKAKSELVELKTGLLSDTKFKQHENAIRRAIAKSHYDYAAELYRELKLNEVAEHASLVAFDTNADQVLRAKALALFLATKLGGPANATLSKFKRRLWELRR